MRRLHLVEPVVGLYAFAMFMTYPLMQQYIYRRLWEQLTGSNFPVNLNFSHCAVDRNLSKQHEEVQREASLFFLYCELCILLPSLLVTLLLVSYSDHRGRKVAILPPLVGEFLFAFSYFLVSYFSLSLNFLLCASFVMGSLGGPTSLIGGCFAYVADLCRDNGDSGGRRTVRMATLDMLLGTLAGLASLSSGFFVREAGFAWPFFTAGLLHLLNLAYVLCVLRETVTPTGSVPSDDAHHPNPQLESLRVRFQGAYLLFTTSTRRRRILLVLVLLAFGFYKVANLGGLSIFILYELNAPLCWNEVLVGYGSALSTVIYLGSFTGVYFLSLCLRDAHVVLLGLLSVAAGLLMAAFAKTTLLMFLVRLPLLLSIMPTPVLRSMMSKIVLGSEQGAVFACVAFVEMLSVGLAFTLFSSVYAATVSWFPGFSFLLASGMVLIPVALISSVLCLGLDVSDDTQGLTGPEDAEAEPIQETLRMPTWDPS